MEDFEQEEIDRFERRAHQSQQETRPDSILMVRDLKGRRDILALANLLDAQAVPTATRRAAAKALAEIAGQAQVSVFVQALKSDPDRGVRLSSARGLGRLANDEALPALVETLKDKEATVRMEAAQALSLYNSAVAFDTLLIALKRPGPENRFVRLYAAEALGKLGDRRAAATLIEALKDESELVRPAVAQALGKLGESAAIDPLQRARHNAPHSRSYDCAECKAIDGAIATLTTKLKDIL